MRIFMAILLAVLLVALVARVVSWTRSAGKKIESMRQMQLFPDPAAQRLADKLWLQQLYIRRVERQG